MKSLLDDAPNLAERLVLKRNELRISNAELARRAGVHPTQVGRILAGESKRLSESVLRICNALGVDHQFDGSPQDRSRIIDSALAIWNGTHEDAELIVELLRQLARMKAQGHLR